jgi:4-diphosphocytidyl-2-C-methyl-D-erythritol kinase
MSTTVRSYSKINLGLAIGPVRPDGFHELTTLYQTLDLHDLVTVTAKRADETRIALTTNHPFVPRDGRNTAWRMVERCMARLGVAAEVGIHIEKRLPVQGGMGAGSANAAAALIGLERELGVSLPGVERLRLAAEIGSDVPLFLLGGAVLGGGGG